MKKEVWIIVGVFVGILILALIFTYSFGNFNKNITGKTTDEHTWYGPYKIYEGGATTIKIGNNNYKISLRRIQDLNTAILLVDTTIACVSRGEIEQIGGIYINITQIKIEKNKFKIFGSKKSHIQFFVKKVECTSADLTLCDDNDPLTADLCIDFKCINAKKGGDYECSFEDLTLCDDNDPLTADLCTDFKCINAKITEFYSSRFEEVIPGYNNLEENRINLVFIGIDYGDKSFFKQRILDIIDINNSYNNDPDIRYSYNNGKKGGYLIGGLLSEPPFNQYKERFNLWYRNSDIDECLICYDETIYPIRLINSTSLLIKHTFTSPDKTQIIWFEEPRSYAWPPSAVIFDSFSYKGGSEIPNLRNVVLHEFGHSFGNLMDEYIMRGEDVNNYSYFSKYRWVFNVSNCGNFKENNLPCQNWCDSMIDIKNLKNYCPSFLNKEECILNSACSYDETTNKCIDEVSFCNKRTNLIQCSKDNCIWTEQNYPYFNSKCIPRLSDFGFGKSCLKYTSCYQGCSYLFLFRGTLISMMNGFSVPFGPINDNLLINKLNKFSDKVYKIADSKEENTIKNVIFYDNFDYEKGLIDGGLIDLNNLELKEKLTEKVAKRLTEGGVGKVAGEIDITNIDPSILIEEYEKVLTEN